MTTICAVKHNGKTAIAGDGQVTLGEKVIMKGSARKVRRIYNDKVAVGFAGGVADAINLEEKFENKLNEYSGNLERAAVELAQEWRGDRTLQKLEAMLIVIDKDNLLIVSGSGEVIAPDNGVLAAAVALSEYSKDMSAGEIAKAALNIAADIDIFTNHNIIVEELA